LLKIRIAILSVFIICFTCSIQSQNPWNRLYDFGLIQANGYGLIEYDGRYFVMGQGLLESDPNLERATFYMSIDLEGNYINDVLLDDGDINTTPTFNNLCREVVELDDYIYSLADDIGLSYIHKSNYDLDSLILLHSFADTLHSLRTPTATSCGEFPAGYFLGITLTDYFPDSLATERMRRLLVSRLDPKNDDTLEQFYYQIKDEGISACDFVVDSKADMIVIGTSESNSLFAIKVDDNMQQIDSIVYEGSWNASYMNAVIDDNDEIMLGIIEFERRGFDLLTRPILIKMNSELELLWTKPFVQDTLRVRGNYITGMVESHDKDGYLICGIQDSELPNTKSILSKIDTEGDTLWYKIIRSLQNVPRKSELFSVIQTSDGNYMAVGKNFTQTFHDTIGSWSQTWLVKFDEDGHILQQGVSAVEPSFTNQIRLYPNPSSDYIYIEQDHISGVKYQLYNLEGKMVYATDDVQAQSINMLDVSIFDSGIYFLHISIPERDKYHVERLIIE